MIQKIGKPGGINSKLKIPSGAGLFSISSSLQRFDTTQISSGQTNIVSCLEGQAGVIEAFNIDSLSYDVSINLGIGNSFSSSTGEYGLSVDLRRGNTVVKSVSRFFDNDCDNIGRVSTSGVLSLRDEEFLRRFGITRNYNVGSSSGSACPADGSLRRFFSCNCMLLLYDVAGVTNIRSFFNGVPWIVNRVA